MHIVIDDHTRLAFAAILPDQKHISAIRFFHMARFFYSRFGFSVRRVLTDNGSCLLSVNEMVRRLISQFD